MICTEHVLKFCLVRGYIKSSLFLAPSYVKVKFYFTLCSVAVAVHNSNYPNIDILTDRKVG